jgi:hypothetical protein
MTDYKRFAETNAQYYIWTNAGTSTYNTHPNTVPQLTSEWNDLLNKVSNFSGKTTFGIIMPLSNHMEDLINRFINRKGAIENTKLTL